VLAVAPASQGMLIDRRSRAAPLIEAHDFGALRRDVSTWGSSKEPVQHREAASERNQERRARISLAVLVDRDSEQVRSADVCRDDRPGRRAAPSVVIAPAPSATTEPAASSRPASQPASRSIRVGGTTTRSPGAIILGAIRPTTVQLSALPQRRETENNMVPQGRVGE